MKSRPVNSSRPAAHAAAAAGYTIVEILVASVLTLMLMGAVVQVFSGVGKSISNSRAALETFDRLRSAAATLRQDLQGVTVTTLPPGRTDAAPGYLEIIEGSYIDAAAVDSTNGNTPDTTVSQRGDILMFTTRSITRPFMGRCNGVPVESDLAEVAWFVRGRTLHRRVLLIAPGLVPPGTTPQTGFYNANDLSVYVDKASGKLVGNSLTSLAKRECRFAHPNDVFPYDARRWGQYGLPTMCECSGSWTAGSWPAPGSPYMSNNQVDLWVTADKGNWLQDNAMGSGPRVADDVVLTNVIGFDVKVWDSMAGAWVDLGGTGAMSFAGTGAVNSGLAGGAARVWGSWSFHYENEGTSPGDTRAGRATNGLDDDNNGIIDDMSEWITSPPYLSPMRGIQVKIRCFEPDSRQVREVTIEQDFLPK